MRPRNLSRTIASLHDVYTGCAMNMQVDKPRENHTRRAIALSQRRWVDVSHALIEVNLTS
jgi:hypothetical protein